MNQQDIVEEDKLKSLQDWWALHSELAERGVDLSRDYIVKTVNGIYYALDICLHTASPVKNSRT